MDYYAHQYYHFMKPIDSNYSSSLKMEFESSAADLKPDISQLAISVGHGRCDQTQSSLHHLPVLQTQAHQHQTFSHHSQPSVSTTQGYFSNLMLQSTPPPAISCNTPVHMALQCSVSPTAPSGFNNLMESSPTQSSVHSPGFINQFNVPDSSGLMSCSSSASGSSTFMNKHICSICGDRASGKHYGVYSCEGCKGFFKRTVRKDLRYTCRDEKRCLIDKRQRNRCQHCRYQKCLHYGMKREAVQEERQRVKEKSACGAGGGAAGGVVDGPIEPEGNSCDGVDTTPSIATFASPQRIASWDMPVEKILEAELMVEPDISTYVDVSQNPVTNICHAADKQLFLLVPWAKRVPHFAELPLEDQIILLKAGWEELLIAAFSYRSTVVQDGILLATGLHVHRNAAKAAGVGTIFERVLVELVAKMRDMKMDRTELGCLRAIVLFNPDAKGLTARSEIESHREKVYASLEEYCRSQYPDEPGRFAKLLLRLPALRSIGLKALEHLFFFKLIGDTPVDAFLMEMLETPHPLP